jgi:uracil-DNA glycosylase
VDLLWLGAQPYPEDVKMKQLFSDRSGSLLRQAAYQAGLPIPPASKSALIAPTVWCMSELGKDILSSHIDRCRVFLDQVIELADPKVILALGSVAMRGVLRTREVGLEGRLGWHTLPSGHQVMVTYHPMNILSSPGLYSKFRGHLDEVKSKLKELKQ